jgi:hypothetical protein
VVYSVSPLLGSALVHVRHGPLYLCLFIREVIWTEAEVCLAGIEEAFAFVAVSVEIWGRGGLQIVFWFGCGSDWKWRLHRRDGIVLILDHAR